MFATRYIIKSLKLKGEFRKSIEPVYLNRSCHELNWVLQKNMFLKKIPSICLGVIFVTLFIISSSLASTAHPVHYNLQIKLFPEEHKLQGKARITLPKTEQEMRFFLAPSVRVDEVSLEGSKLAHSFSSGVLKINFPMDFKGKEASLDISFQGNFADQAPAWPMHTEDPSHGVAATITQKGTFLSGHSGWYPDPRQGAATWSLDVIAPPGYLAVTAGTLIEQTTTPEYSRSIWEVRHPLPNLTVSAGPYQVSSDLNGDIPVYAYFYPQSQDLVRDYLEATRRHLEFYQELLGPYPFDKFAVVENFFPTGYGFPSWTLLGSAVIRLPFIMETSLPHEIAHSWWGNGVRVDYIQGNWSEALTTYVADYLLLERSSDEQARDYRLRILRGYSSLVPEERDFPLSRFMSRDSRESQAIGYGKGAMVFHMLRQDVGEEFFWKGLRRIIRENMFQQISWHDFAEIFSDLAGKDLQPFFAQWVQKPGAPLLFLRDVQLAGQKGDWTVKGTVGQEEPFFELDLPLILETDEQPVKFRVRLDGPEKTFELKSEARPLSLSVDPEKHVFRRLHPGEIPATVENIRGSESLLTVVADGLSQQEAQAAQTLLQTLNRGDVRVIRESDAQAEELQKKDVLFLGLPRDFADQLFEKTDATDFQVRILFSQDGQFSGPDKALFVAVNPNADQEKTWAYLVFSSPEAAMDAVRRIPHYGRYSYLLFDGGEIMIRGTWEPGDPALEHNFIYQGLE